MLSLGVKVTDDKARYVQKTLQESEKNLADMRVALQGYMRNQDRIRRKSIKLALQLKNFADMETPAMGFMLTGTAEGLVELQKHRKQLRDRIEAKSAEPLKLYKNICKGVMTELKTREASVHREQARQVSLQKAAMNSAGEKRISQGQLELANASQEVLHNNSLLADSMERFEMKKLADTKAALHEYLYSEIAYHAKALEVYTAMDKHLQSVDLNEDLIHIQDKMRREPFQHYQ